MAEPPTHQPPTNASWPDFPAGASVPAIESRCDSRLLGKPCAVLVGTADATAREFLVPILEGERWVVTAAGTAQELIAALLQDPVDLVVVDASFVCEGLLDALHRRDCAKPKPYIPFAVILSQPSEQEAYEWMARGAAAFLHAPLAEQSQETLLFVLRSAMRLFPATSSLPPAKLERLSDADWIELVTPSHEAALEQFQRFFAMLYASTLDDDEKRMLHLVISEIGMNAIEWGNQRDASRLVRISYRFLPDRIMVRVRDEGSGFEPENVPDPRENPRLVMEQRRREGKRLGGYGLALVRGLMDRIRFEDAGTVVVMEKQLRYSTRSRPLPIQREGDAGSEPRP